MTNCVLSVTRRELKQWFGVPNVMIFLCSDCLKHLTSSKLFKNHSTMSKEDYTELPTIVQTLNYHCQDHDEKLDSFCPVHNTSVFNVLIWKSSYDVTLFMCQSLLQYFAEF